MCCRIQYMVSLPLYPCAYSFFLGIVVQMINTLGVDEFVSQCCTTFEDFPFEKY